MCALKLQYKAGIKQKQKKTSTLVNIMTLKKGQKKITIQHFQMSLKPNKNQ